MDRRTPGRQTQHNCGNTIPFAEVTSNKNRTKTLTLIVNYSGDDGRIDNKEYGTTKNINGMRLSELAVLLLYRSGCLDANQCTPLFLRMFEEIQAVGFWVSVLGQNFNYFYGQV